jgi:hypothetical protein
MTDSEGKPSWGKRVATGIVAGASLLPMHGCGDDYKPVNPYTLADSMKLPDNIRIEIDKAFKEMSRMHLDIELDIEMARRNKTIAPDIMEKLQDELAANNAAVAQVTGLLSDFPTALAAENYIKNLDIKPPPDMDFDSRTMLADANFLAYRKLETAVHQTSAALSRNWDVMSGKQEGRTK